MSLMETPLEGVGYYHSLRIVPEESNAPDFGVDSEVFAWQDEANCRDADQELFFPEKGAANKKARALCAACSVIEICQDYAINEPEIDGIWGGMTPRERKSVRKERRKQQERKAS